jgi:hypothetical protein
VHRAFSLLELYIGVVDANGEISEVWETVLAQDKERGFLED